MPDNIAGNPVSCCDFRIRQLLRDVDSRIVYIRPHCRRTPQESCKYIRIAVELDKLLKDQRNFVSKARGARWFAGKPKTYLHHTSSRSRKL